MGLPNGVHHLAIATRDIKAQIEFFTQVVGMELVALYWMHGVPNAKHAFVELAGDSYIAFVDHPDNPKDIAYGVTHSGDPGGPVTAGATQHIAGAKGAKKILAINSDPEAPILASADYAVIGDLHEIVPAISAELRKVRS